jgi:hypothetical protein
MRDWVIENIVIMICFTLLAIVFDCFWLVFVSILFLNIKKN